MKFFTKLFPTKKKIEAPVESSISSLAPKVLTKKEDIEKIQPYLDKLKETIDAKGVNNIALTGSYGSGKSTILKTFKAQNDQYKYLNVSLAAFNKQEGDLSQLEKEKLERLLEVSILQQIFYHVKAEQIPESRFKRIINRKWRHYLWIAIPFVIWVISMIMLFKYNYLDKLNPETWKTDQSFSWSGLFFILISFTGIGLLSKFVLQIFSNSKINKVDIKGEIELGEKVNKSVFNEHLEEILYFFECTDYDVVIIEDLDRFDTTDIFTKLREINILLNNSASVGEREINFIYAIGDDVIKDKKERVKFFEYIIPVIPFINSSNAREQLQRLIKEGGLKEDIFSKAFMSDVITFIDDIDMRLLINIFHEFVIYRHALKSELVTKPEELFAMITYKNIEPEDFSQLNNKQGKLYTLINNKKEYIKDFIDTVDREIKEKENRIDDLKKHYIENIKELRKVYIYHVLEKLPSESTIEQSINTLINEEEFQKVIDGELSYVRFEQRYNNQYYLSRSKPLSYNFSDIEKEVNSYYDYETRLKLVEGKSESQIQALHAEIGKLRTYKANIESWELKQIFEEIDLNIYLTNFSNNALLRNLIINGYINENYNHYISLFHEGSVTRTDVIFEQNVKSGAQTDFAYKLDKIEGLLERIDSRYFTRESILNFALVDYLANNYNSQSANYDAIINLLSNQRERSIQFIHQYVADENRPIDIFIKKLTKQWSNFFYYVTEESNYQGDQIYNYLRLILTHADLDDILNQNHDTLIEMISYNSSFLSLVKTKGSKELEKKISALMSKLNIKFFKLENRTEETQTLFDFVYRNSLYKINADNIWQMLEQYVEQIDIEAFQTKNYSTINGSGCKDLIEYIDTNINEYVRDVYLNLETNTKEEERDLIELFNKKNTSTHSAKSISDKMEAVISDISVINDDELMFHLLSISKIKPTWENLHHIYYGYEDVLEDVANFINNGDNAGVLSNIPVPKDKNDDGKMSFIQMWKDLSASPYLSDESFEQTLRASNIEIKIFDFENTAKERLEIMIQKRSFAFDNRIFDKLEEAHTLGLLYLDFYKEKVLEFMDNFEFDEHHFTIILESESYSTEDINSILNEYDITSWDSVAFLSNLQDRLVKDKNIEIDTAKIIRSIAVRPHDNLNVKILNNYFERFNNSEIKEIIRLLKNEEYQKYLSEDTQESLQLEQSSYNDALFELMKDHNYIGSKSKPMKKGGYRIFKNKDTELL